MGLESIIHFVKRCIAHTISTIKHIGKAATVAACLTGAIWGLDKLMNNPAYANTNIGGILNIGSNLVMAGIGNIDPLTLVQSSYTLERSISNPHPAWGNIRGADGIDNGTRVIAVWEDGSAAIYNSDMTSELSQIYFTSSATGITEVPPGFLGFDEAKYAVSDTGYIFVYSASGSQLGLRSVKSGLINDIDFDVERQEMVVSTSKGTGRLNPDGTLNIFSGNSSKGIEIIDLGKYNGEQIDDLFQTSRLFFRMYSDGSYNDYGKNTNLGLTGAINGMAYTTEKAIMAIAEGFYIYPKLGFQQFMNFSVLPSEQKDPTELVTINPPTTNIIIPTAAHGPIQSIYVNRDGLPVILHDDGMLIKYSKQLAFPALSELATNLTCVTGAGEVPDGAGVGPARNIISTTSSLGSTLHYLTDIGVETGSRFLKNIHVDDFRYNPITKTIMLATPDGIYNLDFNGNVNLLKSGETTAVEAVPMNPLYYNMFFQNMTALAFNPDGTWNPDIAGKTVNYSGTPVGLAIGDGIIYVVNNNTASMLTGMPFLEKMQLPKDVDPLEQIVKITPINETTLPDNEPKYLGLASYRNGTRVAILQQGQVKVVDANDVGRIRFSFAVDSDTRAITEVSPGAYCGARLALGTRKTISAVTETGRVREEIVLDAADPNLTDLATAQILRPGLDGAVILGTDRDIRYRDLNHATQILLNEPSNGLLYLNVVGSPLDLLLVGTRAYTVQDGQISGGPITLAIGEGRKITGMAAVNRDGVSELWVTTGRTLIRYSLPVAVNMATTSEAPYDGTRSADIDGDHWVGLSDLLRLADYWLDEGPCQVDLNGDGTIDLEDLAILSEQWQTAA